MSFPYERILCPVDLDDDAGSELAAAAELARHFDATVFLLHVVPSEILSSAAPGVPVPPAAGLNRSREESALARLREASRNVLAGVRCELMVQLGDPAESILRAQKNLHPDVIVMATHGRTGFRRLVLGSVAERVVREAPCPVLTLKPEKKGAPAQSAPRMKP
jgi:nucleotide-binding universal stress UspA family protein